MTGLPLKHKFVPYENGWNLNCQICKFGECDERHSSPTDSADKVDFEKRDQEEMARIIERLRAHQNSTKLPWDFDAEDLSIYQLETIEPITGALCEIGNPDTRSNVRLIVTAVNHHQQLVDALREVLRSRGANYDIKGYDDDGHPLNAEGVARKSARALLAEIDGAK